MILVPLLYDAFAGRWKLFNPKVTWDFQSSKTSLLLKVYRSKCLQVIQISTVQSSSVYVEDGMYSEVPIKMSFLNSQ